MHQITDCSLSHSKLMLLYFLLREKFETCSHAISGQRFPSKSLEMSLQANVHFFEKEPELSSIEGDMFCKGANSYIDVGLQKWMCFAN